MPNHYKFHLAYQGQGRKRSDGKVRTWCGCVMATEWVSGDPTCTRCIEYQASSKRVVDDATLEAARLLKRLYNRKWRERHADRIRAKNREQHLRHREQRLALQRENYRICREQHLARRREWYERNRAHVSEYNRQYKARRKLAMNSTPSRGCCL